jgi:hypothetical protein
MREASSLKPGRRETVTACHGILMNFALTAAAADRGRLESSGMRD